MAYVVSAKWLAKAGKEDRLLEVIREMTPPSRAEPGNLYYQAQRSTEDLVLVNSPGFTQKLDVQFVELFTSVVDSRGRPVDDEG